MQLRLLGLALLAFSLPAQTVNEAALDKIVEGARGAWSAPGIAVAIVKNDQVVYLKAFGVKQLGKPDPVTPDTRMAIGSTTKAFTATAIAILVDDKKMDWDDPVRKHLPDFRLADPLADQSVTLRDLVTHRTGLVRHDVLWYGTPLTRAELLHRIGFVPLSKPFRAAYNYQNIMFLAAGEAVGRASGKTWENFITERIFVPAGMTNSDLSINDALRAADKAMPHAKNPEGVIRQIPWRNIDNIAPAGSINSSARDMARWLTLQMNGGLIGGKRIVSEKELKETHSPQMTIREDTQTRELNPDTNMANYGLGWRLQDYRGTFMISHGGAIDGFRAQAAFLPKEKWGLVILTNLGGNNLPEALRFALFDQLLGLPPKDWNKLYLDATRKQEDEQKQRRADRLAKRFKDAKPSRDLPAYAGKFENPGYGAVEIAAENGNLRLAWLNQRFVLDHFQFDTFETRAPTPGEIVFRLDGKGDIVSLNYLEQEFKRAK